MASITLSNGANGLKPRRYNSHTHTLTHARSHAHARTHARTCTHTTRAQTHITYCFSVLRTIHTSTHTYFCFCFSKNEFNHDRTPRFKRLWACRGTSGANAIRPSTLTSPVVCNNNNNNYKNNSNKNNTDDEGNEADEDANNNNISKAVYFDLTGGMCVIG